MAQSEIGACCCRASLICATLRHDARCRASRFSGDVAPFAAVYDTALRLMLRAIIVAFSICLPLIVARHADFIRDAASTRFR